MLAQWSLALSVFYYCLSRGQQKHFMPLFLKLLPIAFVIFSREVAIEETGGTVEERTFTKGCRVTAMFFLGQTDPTHGTSTTYGESLGCFTVSVL
jgi:hypothetical protein